MQCRLAALVPLATLILVGNATPVVADPSFAFWPGEGARRAAGYESMQEHPCGEVAYARVTRLPPVGKGPLLPELVVELNSKQKVIRRWAMPIDFTPAGVRGEELLVVFGAQKFWVKPNGTFVKATEPTPIEGREVKCDVKSIFGESGYSRCQVFQDVTSSKQRVIGYQGACT